MNMIMVDGDFFFLFLLRNNSLTLLYAMGFPCGSAGKESAHNVGDLGSIPGLGRSPGEGKGYSLQYSDLENSMYCIVHGVTELDMTERLSLSLHFTSPYGHLLSHLSHLIFYDPRDCSPPGSSVHEILQAKIGVGCHALLQGIFPTQGSKPRLLCLLHWLAGSLPRAPPGKPTLLY